MPQRETIIARIPREGLISNLELRVSHRARGRHAVRGVHVGEWWLHPASENSVPTRKGIVIHPSELDEVIAALTEAKNLLASMPWRKSAPCPRCESLEARQARRASADSGSLPTDYYCDLCGAVDGPLRNEPPVIDLTDDENHNWLHEVRRQRLEREQHEGDAENAA
ncbi:MAG: hypothetical protein OXE50_04890 [Chloroflexi bacterium]|nr:hypothetical protein [Chloroflexota bacterium]